MEELMANPLYYWAAIIGLFMATALIVSSGFYMMATAFKVMNVLRMKNYKKSLCALLETTYHANASAGKVDVAEVSKTLLAHLDPKRAAALSAARDNSSNEG